MPTAGKHCVVVPQDTVCTIHEPKNGTILSVDVLLQEGASVEYKANHVQELNLQVTLDQGAHFNQHFAHTQAEKRSQTFILQGEQAGITVTGSYYLKSDTGLFTIMQHHRAPHTTSAVTLKAVLDGSSFFDYQGNILIEQQAAHVVAHQENKNLVVSKQAKARSIPSLEALNNNVQCGHGSAVSYIDQEHLFYLASRGIHESQAKDILIKSFLN